MELGAIEPVLAYLESVRGRTMRVVPCTTPAGSPIAIWKWLRAG
jgi:hypothetical protein